MKSSLAILVCVLALGISSVGETGAEKAAVEGSNHWLSVVDAGDYAASWAATAPLFRAAVQEDQWVQMLQARRAPLGKVISRVVKSAVYKTSLPGAPDGQYVVIQYESSFENKQSAIETVTPSLDHDGQWKVSGYYIR
jgi:hypothetical protein